MERFKNIKTWLPYVVSLLFILLFAYAAVSKLVDYENFRVQLGQSPLLTAFAHWVAWAVPTVELIIAGMLIFPRLRLLGLYGCFTLMVMFTAYIVIILNFTDFIPCSCGGVLEDLGWTEHLIFNIVFVALAATAILLSLRKEQWQKSKIKKNVIASLPLIMLMGIGLVSLLFISSEKRIHKENPFIRRYPHHPATKTHKLDLGYNSYYIAGMDKDKIYLGNYTAPLHLLEVDTTLRDTTEIRLELLEKQDLPFRSVQIRIRPPYFYLLDGTVPVIFRGKIGQWKSKIYMEGSTYFSLAEPVDTNAFAMRARSKHTNENTIVSLRMTDTAEVELYPEILQKQSGGDGIFDTDGTLIYNEDLQKIIYTYYYRNQYMVIQPDMRLGYRGKTIDTITRAQLQITRMESRNARTMEAPPLMVNRKTATSGKYLFIQSELLGRYEEKRMLDQASIIDVYDLTKGTYELSFYIYHENGKKLRQFMVFDNLLVAMIDDKTVTYLLRDKYFKKQNQI